MQVSYQRSALKISGSLIVVEREETQVNKEVEGRNETFRQKDFGVARDVKRL
jgi:hypothetical protein